MLLYHGKHPGHVESLPLEGTSDTTSEIDNIERSCWWYLPTSLGAVVLAYALGWVSAIWSIHS